MSTDVAMLERCIAAAVHRPWLVLLAVLGLVAIGTVNLLRLPIDAVPDITNVQVQINTSVAGYTPLEVEQQVTQPLELELAGLPALDHYRSLSRYGLSQVTLVFRDGTDLYFARQLVGERLAQARPNLPDDVTPVLAPVATGLGEVVLYTVTADPGARRPDGMAYTLTDLREIHDWVVRPQLRQVPGVVEVNAIGGHEKQFQVRPDPAALLQFNVTLDEVAAALRANNANRGAGYVERDGEQLLVRSPGQLAGIADIATVLVKSRNGTPVRVGDLGEVALGTALRSGAATERGREVVLGTAMMRVGENSRTVAAAVTERLVRIGPTLPAGVTVQAVYDRTRLVDRTITTVRTNLMEGALLVIAVLLALLGNLRAGLITAAVIPVTMLMTATGMVRTATSANLMSLGALDFGLIVDGAVIIVENCLRRLGETRAQLGRCLTRAERDRTTVRATTEVIQPAIFGVLVITVVYLPMFALEGIEGRMFQPMAITVVMALAAALVLSLTFVPAAVAAFVVPPEEHRDLALVALAQRAYAGVLDRVLARPALLLLGAAVLVGIGAAGALRLGTEFVPSLDEGDLAVQVLRMPGTGLTQSVAMQAALEQRLAALPEVANVFARTGTAEIATDPMPPSISDSYVMLKPRAQWPDPRKSRAALEQDLGAALHGLPGQSVEVSQPIQLRFNELISGVRADVAVKIYGYDLETLLAAARRLAPIVSAVPGARTVQVEPVTGLPTVAATPDRLALARFGVPLAEVQELLATAIGGVEAGLVLEGDRRFPLVLRLPESASASLAALAALPVALPGDEPHRFVPLGELVQLDLTEGPNQVSRENGKRRIVVTTNVRDRDLGGFIAELKARVAAELALPPGYWVDYGGTFEQLEAARLRLALVVPLALALIFVLLFAAFGSLRDAALVFSGVPLALVGGVAALTLRGLPLSITAAIGFIALSGVAVLNGVVMVARFRSLVAAGATRADAVRRGALERLRPVLITALVASLGFVPMAISVGPGAEVQRPLATVVIGGIVSATVLTLLVLPVVYRRFGATVPAVDRPATGAL